MNLFAIFAIAWNTFREAVRNRILYIVLIFALLLVGSSGIVRDLTIAGHDRIVRDFGLACINFFGLAIAIMVGIGLVYNELDKKSIYTIVSKPIHRSQFLIGKYLGLLLTIYIVIAVMALFFLTVIHYLDITGDGKLTDSLYSVNPQTREITPRGNLALLYVAGMFKAIGISIGRAFLSLLNISNIEQTRGIGAGLIFTGVELAIVTAFALLYSSFSTPTLSAIFTVLTFIAGRLNQDIQAYANKIHSSDQAANVYGSIKWILATGASLVSPNLGAFSEAMKHINSGQAYAVPPWMTICYGILYSAGVVCLAVMIFRGRNFK